MHVPPRSLSLSFVLVALLIAVGSQAQFPIDPPDDPPLPPFCPGRIQETETITTILVNPFGDLPFRRVGNQYEVFFTLNTAAGFTYNPSGACNLNDDIVVKSSSINVASSFTVTPGGANPFAQRSVFVTPQSQEIGVLLCFKAKFHGNDGLDDSRKRTGRIVLPPLGSLPEGVLQQNNAPLTDGC